MIKNLILGTSSSDPEWNNDCDFEKLTENQSKEGDIWKAPKKFKIPENTIAEIECPLMVIRSEGIKWNAIPKHSNVYIDTVEIPYSFLKELENEK